ncbi:MAG TPA: GNAT family N-acetyltransferase [Bacteroidia bacterium]|nr:GNAT family N-acetyltransferase [Bacteroidia bacterium]
MQLEQIDISDLIYPDSWQNCLSVFHQKDFLKIYIPNIHIVGIFNENQTLIGLFYYFKKSRFGVTYIIPPPFQPYNGLIFFPSSEKNETKNSAFKELQFLISEYFTKKERAFYTRFVFSPDYIDTQVFQWNKWKVCVNYTYQLNLDITEDQLFENLSSEKRKSIRKAEKDGIQIVQVKEYNEVENLIKKTFSRQNKKINYTLLSRILKEWANENNSFAFVAYLNEKPIACTFCVYDKHQAYYLLGGYDNELAHHGAGVSCMWKSILKAKQMNLKIFDFEGSMLPNVERYFREFGGNLVPYYSCEKFRYW